MNSYKDFPNHFELIVVSLVIILIKHFNRANYIATCDFNRINNLNGDFSHIQEDINKNCSS